MNRRNAKRNRRKPIARAILLLEMLEDRTLLSTLDGSFQDIRLTNLRADPNFAGIDGHGIGIAVIDSGVYAQNPDLQPNFVHWFDAVTNQDSSYSDVNIDVAAAFDPIGHGSHVAGIAASSNSDIGVAPAASLIGIRAVPAPGELVSGNRDPIATALQWVIAHNQDFNIRVVNLSIGNDTNLNAPPTATSGEGALIAQLQAMGVTVVAASGNDYADFIAPGQSSPAVFSTIGVANVWANNGSFPLRTSGDDNANFLAVEQESAIDRVQAASQRSSMANQVAAPGQDIYSTWNGAGGLLHNTQSGTSMSAPMVSGSVALLEQAAYSFGGRYLVPSEVLSILKETADPITDYTVANNGRVPVVNGQPDFSQQSALPETGLNLKRINVYHAVQKVRDIMQPPSPSPPGDPGDLNGTISGSIPLPPFDGSGSATLTGNIGSDGQDQVGNDDTDLYAIDLTAAGSVDITLGPVDGGTDFDSYLRLFDSSGNEIAANNDISPTDQYSALISPVLEAGRYFVGVSSFANTLYNIFTGAGAASGTTGGDYQLSITEVNPDPNGTLGGAVNFAGLPAAFTGDIGTDPAPNGGTVTVGPQDVDVYQVVAPDSGTLIIDAKTGRFGSGGASTFLRVFDSQGNEIASGSAGTGSTDNHLEVAVTAGEVVYVAVSDASNTGFDPSNPYTRAAGGTGGQYDLFIDFTNGDQNGTIDTATPEPVDGSFGGDIGFEHVDFVTLEPVGADGSKDVDIYSFAPTSSGLLDINVAGQSGFIPDVSLRTPDQGAAIPASVNAQGAAELIVFVQPGLSYYLAVTGRGNGDFHWNEAGSGSGGMLGSYTATSSLQPFSGSLNSITNGSIQGNPSAITTVTLGQPVSGNIGRDGNLIVGPSDVDLYKFIAPATQTIAVRTDTSFEGSSSTFLRFFDANGNELAYNANANGATTSSLLVVSVTAGQTYYVGVNGYSAGARNYNALTGSGAVAGSQGNYLLALSGPPTSQVGALPAFEGTDFVLNWSGTPGLGGSAIASYDVFVSDNGGPFAPFVTRTSQTSATFHGSTGHTYSFYSVAIDRFGNRQTTPAAGQATTRVDTTPPTSAITVLPGFSPAIFVVSWSGIDDPGGSGVAGYDVYVSDNGSAFQPFVSGAANTSAFFHGQNGHIYAFNSVATDRMGNRQATPSVAQATTTVDALAPTSSVLALPLGSRPDFLVRWSGTDAGGSGIAYFDVYVSDDGGPFTPFVTGTSAESATFHGDDGHSYSFFSVATDHAGNRQATPAAAQATTQAAAAIYVTGADAGGGPDVKVFDAASGQVKFNFFAYDPRFTGGVRVAVGDVNGDGFPDIICAAGPGGGPNITVFDGRTGQPLDGPLGSFFAFDPRFTGGLYVAAADINGDGYADIICGADAGGGPNVTVFSGKDGSRLMSFFPFDPRFTGGVRVAAGDVSGDGRPDIIAAAGPGGGPQVRVFNAADGALIGSFFAYDPRFTGGVYVAAGDVNGDGRADVVAAAGPGGGPQVTIFSGADFSLIQSYFAYKPAFTGGVRVGTVDGNDDGRVEIVTVAGPGGGPDVRTIDPLTLHQIDDFFAYDPRFSGGLYVAGVGR